MYAADTHMSNVFKLRIRTMLILYILIANKLHNDLMSGYLKSDSFILFLFAVSLDLVTVSCRG